MIKLIFKKKELNFIKKMTPHCFTRDPYKNSIRYLGGYNEVFDSGKKERIIIWIRQSGSSIAGASSRPIRGGNGGYNLR